MARKQRKNIIAALIDHGEKKSPLRHNERGEEILDPTPIAIPMGLQNKQPSLSEQIAQQVRQMKLELYMGDDSIQETEDEADDFEVGDDVEPMSKWENDHIPPIAVLKQRAKEINDQIQQANREAAIAAHEKAILKPAAINNPPIQPESAKNI